MPTDQVATLQEQSRDARAFCPPRSPLHPEDEVVPLAAVVQPAPHAAHSGVGMEALPPADHCPTGHTLQLGPPLPVAQTADEQAARRVEPVALVVEPEGHAVQAALGTEGVPPAE